MLFSFLYLTVRALFGAQLRAVRPIPDLGAYFRKVLDSRVRAQIGYHGWVADFPSAGLVAVRR
jgi:hypothetical protein